MSKSKAAIVIYARLEGLGWRRGSVIISRNGQAKTGYMRVSKKEYRIAPGLGHLAQSRTLEREQGADLLCG